MLTSCICVWDLQFASLLYHYSITILSLFYHVRQNSTRSLSSGGTLDVNFAWLFLLWCKPNANPTEREINPHHWTSLLLFSRKIHATLYKLRDRIFSSTWKHYSYLTHFFTTRDVRGREKNSLHSPECQTNTSLQKSFNMWHCKDFWETVRLSWQGTKIFDSSLHARVSFSLWNMMQKICLSVSLSLDEQW